MESLENQIHESESRENLIRSKFHFFLDEEAVHINQSVDQNELKERIAENDGEVLILVHPFCEEVSGLPKQYKRIDEHNEVFRSNLDTFNNEIEVWLGNMRRPTILLEERTAMDATIQHCIKKDILPSDNVYILPTMRNYGTPYLPMIAHEGNEKDPFVHPFIIENHRQWVHDNGFHEDFKSEAVLNADNRTAYYSWCVLYTFFKDVLGAKKVLLGGKFIDICEYEGEKSLGRCLGEAYNYLDFISQAMKDEGLEVELTNATFPLQKDKLKGVSLLRKGAVFE